ncbi:hypothetical protein DDZ13_14960 [Coraliomargarita sinensis]|uniref:Lipoprotein n=1 Tax=Coraliomargarita sinensis TaxID=2174842 RepID=A0A317ZDS1_9BACT|nr:hypothetical protein [Coraliomargarita sinensis]PXA02852.1 hypothetical protein DDZ13_14960 [Coraliomargarita sinensis]
MSKKVKIFWLPLFFVLGACLGGAIGLSYFPKSIDVIDGRVFIDGNFPIGLGKKYDRFHQVIHLFTVDGINVNGQIKGIEIDQIYQIISMIEEEDNSPVLSIRFISKDRIEVNTGKTRGPLDGGGNLYMLHLKDGEWQIMDRGSWVS